MNFGLEFVEGHYILYFHGTHEGRKIDLIQFSPNVGFEMDTNYELNETDAACGYSARFQSIMGNGRVSMVSSIDEKKHGLELLMQHNTGKREWGFTEQMINAVAVFKLEIEKMSCIAHC